MIALITPTGGREKQINLCVEYMKRQDYQGEVLWIIIDDVEPKTTEHICVEDGFGKNWKIIKIYPTSKWRKGMNTQASNLLIGINVVRWYRVEAIFIIEDDDYYFDCYLTEMLKQLKGHQVTGQKNTIYCNVSNHMWFQCKNENRASLFQVAFTTEMLDLFEVVCKENKTFIDIEIFKRLDKSKVNLFDGRPLSVGIKGLPGRTGIGKGHKGLGRIMNSDEFFIEFRKLIGKDYKYYYL